MYEYNEGPCTGEHLGRGSRNGFRVYRGHRSTYTTNEQTFVRVLLSLSLSLSLTLCDHPLNSLSLCHSLHTDPHSLLTAALSSHSILFAEILRGYDCIPAGSLLRLRSRTPARKRKCSCEISRRKGLVTRGCKCHSSAHVAITIATMEVANSWKRENVSWSKSETNEMANRSLWSVFRFHQRIVCPVKNNYRCNWIVWDFNAIPLSRETGIVIRYNTRYQLWKFAISVAF